MTTANDGKRVTITDVAREAGVSIKTVSRVMNREPNVHEETRGKVEAAMARLRYVPDPSARSLAGVRSRAIGLVYENPEEFSYTKALLDQALDACERRGHALFLRPVETNDSLVDVVDRFVQQTRVDGIILSAPLGDDPRLLERLRRREMPFTRVSPRSEGADERVVGCDDRMASHALTRSILDLGHRHIAYLRGSLDHGASERRFEGFRDAMDEAGIAVEPKWVFQGQFDFESGRRAAARLLRGPRMPTALIAANDDMAAGVLFECHRSGVRVPEDLSVAGFDDSAISTRIWPTVTTVRQPIAAMADAAVAMLIDPAAVPDDPRMLPCEVVPRGSTAPPAAS